MYTSLGPSQKRIMDVTSGRTQGSFSVKAYTWWSLTAVILNSLAMTKFIKHWRISYSLLKYLGEPWWNSQAICGCDRSGPSRDINCVKSVGYCLQEASNSWKVWRLITVHSPLVLDLECRVSTPHHCTWSPGVLCHEQRPTYMNQQCITIVH